jgi:hypothetical protein
LAASLDAMGEPVADAATVAGATAADAAAAAGLAGVKWVPRR